jgi:tetratricopeptide (TPR) repeat protein
VAAARLVEQCGRLPLTLRVAAELAASRPSAQLADLVDELKDEKRRLGVLDLAGDDRTAVRTVFSWSYRHLPATVAHGFRLLGWHHGPEFTAAACAALLDVTFAEADTVLTTLLRAHLVEPRGLRRFAMHDLIRAYASELADAEEGHDERRRALSRLFSYYLEAAAGAMDVLVPAERHRRPRVAERVNARTSWFAEPKEARAWLEEERVTLVVASTVAALQGWATTATSLATTLYRFFEIGGHYADALKVHANARHAAFEAGTVHEEAWALTNLGVVLGQLGRPLEAVQRHEEALRLFRKVRDKAGEARSLTNLGLVHWRRGEYRRAETCHRQARRLFQLIGDGVGVGIALTNTGNALRRRSEYRPAISSFEEALRQFGEVGDDVGSARALTSLGLTLWRLGQNEAAERLHKRALATYRSIGHKAGEADALDNLGLVDLRLGRDGTAYKHHFASLRLSRQIGDRYGESDALLNLGIVHLRQRKHERAERFLVDALNLYCDIGDRGGESRALNDIGRFFLEIGHIDSARHRHECALELARRTGDRYEQARAHDGLARVHHAKRHLGRARRKWQTAAALFSALGVPEAVESKNEVERTSTGTT